MRGRRIDGAREKGTENVDIGTREKKTEKRRDRGRRRTYRRSIVRKRAKVADGGWSTKTEGKK